MQFFFDFSCTVKIFALYLHSQSGNMVATFKNYCGNSSVGRAQPCQGWGREFESRFPLKIKKTAHRCLFCFLYIEADTTRDDRFRKPHQARLTISVWRAILCHIAKVYLHNNYQRTKIIANFVET